MTTTDQRSRWRWRRRRVQRRRLRSLMWITSEVVPAIPLLARSCGLFPCPWWSPCGAASPTRRTRTGRDTTPLPSWWASFGLPSSPISWSVMRMTCCILIHISSGLVGHFNRRNSRNQVFKIALVKIVSIFIFPPKHNSCRKNHNIRVLFSWKYHNICVLLVLVFVCLKYLCLKIII